MSQQSALAKPRLSKAVQKLMCDAGSDAPGYRELDGTTYRVLSFDGNPEIPQYLRDRFVGAIAEWANDAEELTALTMYESLESFGADFARIDICADQI
jgi:hypothetical protein